jgi:hypothetical protein
MTWLIIVLTAIAFFAFLIVFTPINEVRLSHKRVENRHTMGDRRMRKDRRAHARV